MDFSLTERFRELLENYRLVATGHFIAMLPTESPDHLINNVRAALVASTLQLQSLDYAKKRYASSDLDFQATVDQRLNIYENCYSASKDYIHRSLRKLRTLGRRDPTVDEFGSSLVLERLPTSFFSSHLLYRIGQKYEGHAVSRMILEQMAWAYAAADYSDLDKIKNISPTKSVSRLKEIYPQAGELYGYLSKKTHIDYSSHFEFLTVQSEKNVVLHSNSDFQEYAKIIILLADIFGVVWEYSQRHYIDGFDSVKFDQQGKLSANSERSFVKIGNELLGSFQKAT